MTILNLVNDCLSKVEAHAHIHAPAYNEMRAQVLRDYPAVDRKLNARATSILPDMTHAIGGTPMVALDRIRAKHNIQCKLLAKAEFMSAGGSVKDRLARRMIELIEAEGKIKKGDIVVEATSGNTGIGLALMCAVRGYQAVIVMPEKMSAEKANTLKALGAIVIRTRTSANWDDEDSHIVTAYRFVAEVNSRSENTGIAAFIPDQYQNPGNILAHYQETANEILSQTGNHVDVLVASAGTGGTVTGVAHKLKEALPQCVIVGVDPKGSILHKARGTWTSKDITPYEVEGIGYDFYPASFHQDIIDEWLVVSDADSFQAARDLISLEGMLVGGSSGTALAAALMKAKTMRADETLVVILPDNIRNYLTKFASDDWMTTLSFSKIHSHPMYQQCEQKLSVHAQSVLDDMSISLGQLPSFSVVTKVNDALKTLAEKKMSHGLVRDASGVLVGVISREDLHQSILSLRGDKKPLAEIIHSSYLLVLPSSASLATFATLSAATEGAMKSRNHAILMIQGNHTGFEEDNVPANRIRLQNMSESDQRSGLVRLVTKDMIAQAILTL